MREAHDELAGLGANVIAVGGSADYQAKALQPDFPFPLLLDSEHVVRERVGLGTLSAMQMLSPKSVWRYLRSIRSHTAPGRITSDREQTPGVVIADTDLAVAWIHRGGSLGDYPSIATVRDEIARL